jgi:hypothetical protein
MPVDLLRDLRPELPGERCDEDRLRWRTFERRFGLYRKVGASLEDELWQAQPLGIYDGPELAHLIRILPGVRPGWSTDRPPFTLSSYQYAARHAAIEELYEVATFVGGLYVVSRYWEGASLAEVGAVLRQREAALPPALGAAIFDAGVGGLEALHDAGFCHGRLSSSRVRLAVAGPAAVVLCGCYPFAVQFGELRLLPQDPAAQAEDRVRLAAIVGELAGTDADGIAAGRGGMIDPDDVRALWQIVVDLVEERRAR